MCRYYAVIECLADGSTFTQGYDEFEDLLSLYDSLGPSYKIVHIYGGIKK